MSSHRKCPLVGVSLPLHFSTLRQEKASGGKSPVVETKLWWCLPHLFSNASLSSKLFSPKALLDKGVLPHHSCSTRRFFPATPAPPGVPSHHSCSTKRFFPTNKGLLHTILSSPSRLPSASVHVGSQSRINTEVDILSQADTVRKVVGKSSLNSPGHLVPAALGGVFFFSAHLHWKLA